MSLKCRAQKLKEGVSSIIMKECGEYAVTIYTEEQSFETHKKTIPQAELWQRMMFRELVPEDDTEEHEID